MDKRYKLHDILPYSMRHTAYNLHAVGPSRAKKARGAQGEAAALVDAARAISGAMQELKEHAAEGFREMYAPAVSPEDFAAGAELLIRAGFMRRTSNGYFVWIEKKTPELDPLERAMYERMISKGVEPENALRVLWNNAEGDKSQISPGLLKYGAARDWK